MVPLHVGTCEPGLFAIIICFLCALEIPLFKLICLICDVCVCVVYFRGASPFLRVLLFFCVEVACAIKVKVVCPRRVYRVLHTE